MLKCAHLFQRHNWFWKTNEKRPLSKNKSKLIQEFRYKPPSRRLVQKDINYTAYLFVLRAALTVSHTGLNVVGLQPELITSPSGPPSNFVQVLSISGRNERRKPRTRQPATRAVDIRVAGCLHSGATDPRWFNKPSRDWNFNILDVCVAKWTNNADGKRTVMKTRFVP